jgi:hypothetical protein
MDAARRMLAVSRAFVRGESDLSLGQCLGIVQIQREAFLRVAADASAEMPVRSFVGQERDLVLAWSRVLVRDALAGSGRSAHGHERDAHGTGSAHGHERDAHGTGSALSDAEIVAVLEVVACELRYELEEALYGGEEQ